jgi:hypothetical protein
MPGKSAITSKFEQSAVRTFFPRTAIKPITEDYIQKNQYIAPTPSPVVSEVIIEQSPTTQYSIPNKVLKPRVLPTIYQAEKILDPIVTDNPNITYASKQNNNLYNIPSYNLNTYNDLDHNSGNINNNYISNEKDIPYSSFSSRPIQNAAYTSSRMAPGNNNIQDTAYSSHKTRDKELNIPYSSAKVSENYGNDLPYSSNKTRNKELNTPYTSSRIGFKAGDAPYSSSQIMNKNDKYIQGNTINPKGSRASNYNKPKGSRAPNVTYTSKKQGNTEKGYSSSKQGMDDNF